MGLPRRLAVRLGAQALLVSVFPDPPLGGDQSLPGPWPLPGGGAGGQRGGGAGALPSQLSASLSGFRGLPRCSWTPSSTPASSRTTSALQAGPPSTPCMCWRAGASGPCSSMRWRPPASAHGGPPAPTPPPSHPLSSLSCSGLAAGRAQGALRCPGYRVQLPSAPWSFSRPARRGCPLGPGCALHVVHRWWFSERGDHPGGCLSLTVTASSRPCRRDREHDDWDASRCATEASSRESRE